MYTHNLDPVLFDFGFLVIRWYSLAYIFGILIGWWLGKRIILKKFKNLNFNFHIKEFDNLITYIIISMLLGGRIGYILFYNFEYYLSNPFDILKIWEGGMSFHGALIGVILGTYSFAIKKNIPTFFLLDIIAFVAPIGIFFGRIANFINGELIGKTTDVFWGVIFPKIDNSLRHPSQLYEAFFEGIVLFIIMYSILFRKNYKTGTCSYMFLIFYGIFRTFSEFFREPDSQIGYLFGPISMGMILSFLMILAGTIIFFKKK
ncbi:MAG: prolipoprotein diacylglyceryl transferase [Candidatus Pelagibacter sp. TMED128]|nr:MAG: prolipoprotein diacylglyceryl transferase [Candidatus Pelagibacter sp. TMED128]|tara:strand:- start:545 stop:1324 length:780 start_codon:yes stop_codon:yes gene_type:complete